MCVHLLVQPSPPSSPELHLPKLELSPLNKSPYLLPPAPVATVRLSVSVTRIAPGPHTSTVMPSLSFGDRLPALCMAVLSGGSHARARRSAEPVRRIHLARPPPLHLLQRCDGPGQTTALGPERDLWGDSAGDSTRLLFC